MTPRPTDLALLDEDQIVLVVDIKSAREVYYDLIETDDLGETQIWLGRDSSIMPTDTMAQVLGPRGLEWIQVERLTCQKD